MKQLLQQMLGIWVEGTKAQRALGALSVLVVGLGLWAAVYLSTRPDQALLFGNLEPADAAQVLEEVRGAGVNGEVRDGGSSVYVPRESVAEMRMLVSTAGLPRGAGNGWELFDKSSFGVSDFEQNVMFRRALEGELARSIMAFDAVDNARVSITKPKRSAFVAADQQAKASVVVRTRNGRALSGDNVAAIRHLVAGAVEDLDPERVSVVDSRGRMLSEPERDSVADAANTQVELRQKMENYLMEKAQAMLDQVGVRAVVRVALDMDFQQVRQTSETYSPEGRVLSETVLSNSNKPSSTGGEGPAGAKEKVEQGLNLLPGGGIATESSEEKVETQYKLDRTVTSEENTSPKVQRMTVSMFLHQDQQANLQRIEGLVKAAVGFDDKRGDLMESMPFDFGALEEVPAIDEVAPTNWLWIAERALQAIGILGALFILFKALRVPAGREPSAADVAAALRANMTEAEADAHAVRGERDGRQEETGQNLRDLVRSTVESDPGAATRVLRSWLREGNPN